MVIFVLLMTTFKVSTIFLRCFVSTQNLPDTNTKPLWLCLSKFLIHMVCCCRRRTHNHEHSYSSSYFGTLTVQSLLQGKKEQTQYFGQTLWKTTFFPCTFSVLPSISSTFYAQIFRTKVLLAAFFLLTCN